MSGPTNQPPAVRCEECGKNSKHLDRGTVPELLDDGDSGRTALVMTERSLCRRCAASWGLLELTRAGDLKDFYFNEFFGRVAESAVEAVFRSFGFVVHPFGYERILGGVTNQVSRRTTVPALKLRTIPDLVLVGNGPNDTYLAEIKATTRPIEDFTMDKRRADLYAAHWPEALLIVYLTATHEIYCNRIGDLDLSARPIRQGPDGEYIWMHLKQDAFPLDEFFGFAPERYDAVLSSIKDKLRLYNP